MKSTVLMAAIITTAVSVAGPGGKAIRFGAIDSVDVATNADVAQVAPPWTTDSLAVAPNGTLYSADGNGMLWNVTNPGPIPVGPIGFGSIGDLDYANGGLWGYSNQTTSLFFFDLTLLSVTATIPLPGLAAYAITGVAHKPSNGSIFLSGNTGPNMDSLFEVPLSATSANLVGSLAHSDALSYVSDIDFDASGNLIAMTWFHRHFLSVNTSTAATNLISAGPHRDATGLALDPVPEPTSLLALGVGTLLMRRRSRS